MATNFPTSLDTFTNPNSGNTLDSPSHSIQHSDINDAVEAIEAKIGVGSSTAGSATAGYALVNTSGGTTAYSLLGVSGLSSGTAVANTVLTANGSGAATFAPTAQGLTLLIPSSVAVGSGSGSVSATGAVTFSGASSVSVNDVFSATYDFYKIVGSFTASATNELTFRLRVGGADNSTASSYIRQSLQTTNTTVAGSRTSQNQLFTFTYSSTPSTFELYVFNPFAAAPTGFAGYGGYDTYIANIQGYHNQSVSYTGITALAVSGNLTGSISILGVNK